MEPCEGTERTKPKTRQIKDMEPCAGTEGTKPKTLQIKDMEPCAETEGTKPKTLQIKDMELFVWRQTEMAECLRRKQKVRRHTHFHCFVDVTNISSLSWSLTLRRCRWASADVDLLPILAVADVLGHVFRGISVCPRLRLLSGWGVGPFSPTRRLEDSGEPGNGRGFSRFGLGWRLTDSFGPYYSGVGHLSGGNTPGGIPKVFPVFFYFFSYFVFFFCFVTKFSGRETLGEHEINCGAPIMSHYMMARMDIESSGESNYYRRGRIYLGAAPSRKHRGGK